MSIRRPDLTANCSTGAAQLPTIQGFSQTEVTQNVCTSTVLKYNRAGKKHVSINKGLRVIAGGSRLHLNTELHPPNKQFLCHAAVNTTPEAPLLIFTPLCIYHQGDIEKQWASFQSSGNVEFKCFQYKHRAAGSIPLLTGLTLPGEDTHAVRQSQLVWEWCFYQTRPDYFSH